MLGFTVVGWRTEEKVMVENLIKFLNRKMFFQWNPTSQVLIVISSDFTFWQSVGKFNPNVHFSRWVLSFSTSLL